MTRRVKPRTYIHEQAGWPGFRWEHERISPLLVDVRHRQGRLIGRMEGLGMLTRGALAFDRSMPLDIVFDAATPTWGVFEFINQGTVAPGVVDFAANSTWKFPAEPSTLVGRKYRVPVCMVYQIDANGHIASLHEYTDVASLMKSIE